jgi:hypothetical protein
MFRILCLENSIMKKEAVREKGSLIAGNSIVKEKVRVKGSVIAEIPS